MSKRRVLFLVPFILASILTAAMHPHIAVAQGNDYDIEGSARWCANGVFDCSWTNGDSWNIYISIDGPYNDQPSGTPTYVGLECRHAYDTGHGRVADRGVVRTDISSEISGNGRIFGNDLLEDPNAAQWGILSNVTAVAPDNYEGSPIETAKVNGSTLINSYDGRRISGGFRVTISPYIHDILNSNGSVASSSVVYGTLACSSPNNNFAYDTDYDASFDFTNTSPQ